MTNAGVVVAACLAAWLSVGCDSAAEESCKKACDRPFDLMLEAEAPRVNAWRGFPEPLKNQAMGHHAAWVHEVEAGRKSYVPQCVDSCVSAGATEVVSCRRKSQSLAAWTRCGEAE